MERKTYPFELPDGTHVLVRAYNIDDTNKLNQWVKRKYLENVREACYGLEESTKLELRLAALNNAAKLSFYQGEGQEILMGDIQGFAYMGYLLIEQPPFTFNDYFYKLYPDGVLCKEGLSNLLKMMGVAYETPTEDASDLSDILD